MHKRKLYIKCGFAGFFPHSLVQTVWVRSHAHIPPKGSWGCGTSVLYLTAMVKLRGEEVCLNKTHLGGILDHSIGTFIDPHTVGLTISSFPSCGHANTHTQALTSTSAHTKGPCDSCIISSRH